MASKRQNSAKAQTSQPLRKESTGIDRLYKRTGVKKVSFYYQYADGRSETLATAQIGQRQEIADAERKAKRLALDINEGKIIAGSIADVIDRFKTDVAPTHYLDQSKDGLAVRESGYANLVKFFGKMAPMALKTVHGYQFLDARAKAGAPAKANKELALFSTICHFAVRWGVIEANPFVGIMQNKTDSVVRNTSRDQIIKFYYWSRKQPSLTVRTMGCAAMFTYLTGFRPSEVRPFHITGITKEGVLVVNAKRKLGQKEITKLREWSPSLRRVIARAKQNHGAARMYLFANSTGSPYSRSGWGSVWTDALHEWIASFDVEAKKAWDLKRVLELQYRAEYSKGQKRTSIKVDDFSITGHLQYFSLQNVRPAAITTKLRNRDADAYDFAAHANPSTTHKHYDHRTAKKAKATE
ncbi:hypothetical protein [Undibacterium sp. TJN19]|uniref:hypothetical protein n=1 Tax=Undibacterium sp. TJN19 TaxID=3413055 RepID=UPI003BF199AF